MGEFGQTGAWQFIPVKLCIGIVAAYCIYAGVPSYASFILNGPPQRFQPTPAGTFLGQPAFGDETHPQLLEFPVVGWVFALYRFSLGILSLTGVLSALSFIVSSSYVAYLLYLLTSLYACLYAGLLAATLYGFRMHYILEELVAFRTTSEAMFVGQLEWPTSFWYDILFRPMFQFWMIYSAADIFYSWYLILQAGGSGWEALPARELPGWERYVTRVQKPAEGGYSPGDAETAEMLMQMMSNTMTQDQLEALSQMLQQKHEQNEV